MVLHFLQELFITKARELFTKTFFIASEHGDVLLRL
jgi:hypothetical protein